MQNGLKLHSNILFGNLISEDENLEPCTIVAKHPICERHWLPHSNCCHVKCIYLTAVMQTL